MHSTSEPHVRTDEELIAEAAREGSDGPAFRALLERHRERVWRVCYRLMANEEDAHDAVQEVFVRLFLQRAKFEGRSKFTTWLHGMAIRTCLTLRRTRGRRKRRETVVAEDNTRRQSAGQPAPGLALEVMQLLEDLPEEDRALLILKFAEGYSYEDLSEMFDLSVSACKMRISRARDRLQQIHGERKQEPRG